MPSSSTLLLALLALTRTIFAGDAFTLIASLPNSPLDKQGLQAAGQRIWIGKPPNISCEPDVTDCAKVVNTIFLNPSGANGTLALNVDISGGQYVYVAHSGELAYSVPRHMGTDPTLKTPVLDGIPFGFTYSAPPPGSDSSEFGKLTYEDGKGLMACALTPDAKTTGPWQVFSHRDTLKSIPSNNLPNCVDFDAITSNNITGPGCVYAYA